MKRVYQFQLCFLMYLAVVCTGEEPSRGPKRTKVSPYAGIIPFLRTGRSGHPHFTLSEYESNEPVKHAKSGRTIVTFPGVGRSGTLEYVQGADPNGMDKRSDLSGGNGLWFGPRLGRVQKRYKGDTPAAYLYFGEYTPRLGRESAEEIEDDGEDESNLNKSM
ncbi:uncharacterized protein LOC116168745 isoform X2 [Photinus pyralis]|uniref:uncharacterized protein LOC116168745 isoform X2 n=1 Tax=Photinus pyralis TaxID=7054 RepID=UPI00126746EB|nr:uncharacterized protein LOC116168745 isoform X2 [Photinus pyralis]